MEEIIVVTTEELELPTEEVNNDFYAVSPLKFSIFFLTTIGTYSMYWFYRNWKQQKLATGESCWPIMRGIFSIFFTHSLFRRVDKKLKASDKKYHWDYERLATYIVVATISSNILGKISDKNIGSPYTDIACLILIPFVGAFMLCVQKAINLACNDPDGESNNKLTALNFLWIALGSAIIILSIIGYLLPEA